MILPRSLRIESTSGRAATDAVVESQTSSGLSAHRRHLRLNHLCIANPLPTNTKIPTISSIGPPAAPPNDTTSMKLRNPRTRQASSPMANVSKVTISNLNLCLKLQLSVFALDCEPFSCRPPNPSATLSNSKSVSSSSWVAFQA